MPGEKISVLVVDDQHLYHELIKALVAPHDDIEVVGVASSIEEALSATSSLLPDVVVMDHLLPDGHGTDAAKRITTEHPTARVLMLTATADEPTLKAARKARCSGYVTKDHVSDQIVTAIRGAYRGESTVPTDSLGLFLTEPH